MTSLESAFAARVGAAHAYSFWKGRVALSAILDALNVREGDEVILPGFTCVVVPNAVQYAGARPVYVDVQANTLNLDPEQVAQAVTPRTRAIIVQHTFGRPASLQAILSLARQRGLAVIEDCAHALGVRLNGRCLGTIGQAAFFSFQWSKPITSGLGGMAVTNDPALGRRLAAYQARCAAPGRRETATLWAQIQAHRWFFTPRRYWMAMNLLRRLAAARLLVGSSEEAEIGSRKPLGYEKRMSAVQASAAMGPLAALDGVIRHRLELCQTYQTELGRRGLPTVDWASDPPVGLLRYPILVKNKAAVLQAARRERVELGDWFVSPLHPVEAGLQRWGYTSGQCPLAEEVAAHIVNLPTHPRVSQREVQRTLGFLERMRREGHV